MSSTVAEYKRRSRARHPGRDNAQARVRDKVKRMSRPFVGVDGEGAGVDEIGRQNYMLLRAGDDYLMEPRHLSTFECLEFIADLDPSPIYVGYYFNYDVTMILRDVPPDLNLLAQNGVNWNGFKIHYMPNKEFWVCRSVWNVDVQRYEETTKRITINDVGPFFQCPFYKALGNWKIGNPEQLKEIAAGKALRPEFSEITTQIFSYNRLECEMLAELMECFREMCGHCNIIPDRWQGPGWIAAKMLHQNGILKTKELSGLIDPRLWDFANKAYYGGRFEVTRIGHVAQQVFEYDICSAYPHGMLPLPCLQHGEWSYTTGVPTEAIYMAEIHFRYPSDSFLCDFPIRNKKTGTIFWPTEGNGWYHSVEIEAALDRDVYDFIDIKSAWQYHRQCDCKPFGEFVPRIYSERKSIGKGTKGYPLKLGLNSLYGKLCQSIGAAPYANPIWGGQITAHCRAALIKAYAQLDHPEDVVMLATDGIYTLRELKVTVGDHLGEWEAQCHSGMFLLKPGVYYYDTSGKAPKTRGVARSVLMMQENKIRSLFSEWLEKTGDCPIDLLGMPVLRGYAPTVEIPVINFIGRRLAIARGKPETAGVWKASTRVEKMDWSTKRDGGRVAEDGRSIITIAKRGSPKLMTDPYRKQIGRVGTEPLTHAELMRYNSAMIRDDQPDWIGELNVDN